MSSQIHEDGRVFDAQMTSCALRYDVIYHPSPINSQYLNTSYVGSWQPRKCPLWKGVFDQMLALYWSSSYTRVTMWASTAPIITKCPEYNNRNSMTTIGTLRSNDATAMRTSLKKWIYVLSVFIAIISTHLLCQMKASPPGVEFLGTICKYRKRN